MALCKKTPKPSRPPLQPREGPYRKTNAYTTKPSLEQILTLALALLVVVLHSIFLVSPIRKIDHPILYIMLAINYILVVCLVYVYVRITIFDPVDSYIVKPGLAESEMRTKNIVECRLCRSFVHEKSYHCKRCNRCTEDFDHHCVYLNNCIGSLNYEMFVSLLLLYIFFLVNNIGQCIWVFVAARNDPEVSAAARTEWMAIAILVLCFLQLVATAALMGFHCYISCCLDLTTIAFYQSETESKRSVQSSS